MCVQRGLPEHFARYRRDDRQDHHRQHDARGEDRAAAGHRDVAVGEQRQPAQVCRSAIVRTASMTGASTKHPPQPEDDRRHRRQQVDDPTERTCASLGWCVVASGTSQCRSRSALPAAGAVAELSTVTMSRSRMPNARLLRVGRRELGAGEEVRLVRAQRRYRLGQQEHGDQHDRHHDHQTRGGGEPLEYGVADAASSRPMRGGDVGHAGAFRSGPDPGRCSARGDCHRGPTDGEPEGIRRWR